MAVVHCMQPAAARLGECPRWHEAEQRLYWTDIDGRRLWRLALDGSDAQCAKLAHKTGCFAFRAGGGLVLAMEDGVYAAADPFADPRDLQLLCPHPDPEHAAAGGRFNDGRCDARGRLFVGTVDPKRAGRAKLYCLEPGAGAMREVQAGLITCNGIAFHPHAAQLWYADTPAKQVYRCDYDLDAGRCGQRQVACEFPQEQPARPDGACFDREGNYWCALYAGGCVVQISGTGEVLQRIEVPATYTTMPAFAGSHLESLAVTSALRADDNQEQQRFADAGGVFLISGLAARGCAEHPFQG